MPHWIITWADWCGARFALATNFSRRITVPRKFNLPYAIADQRGLLCANSVPTSISPTLYGLLYSVVMFLQQRTKDTGTNNPIDQDVDRNTVVHDVVVVIVAVVDDDDDDPLELLQRWSPAGHLKSKLLNIFAVSTNIALCDKNNNCRRLDPRYDMNFCAQQFLELPFTFSSFQKNLFDSFQNFSNSFLHGIGS